MNHSLVYTHRAAKDIRKLPPQAKKRIGETLLRYKEEPLYYGKRLVNFSLGRYRFRIGEYRVIFDIENSDIVILRVGHRKDIYKG